MSRRKDHPPVQSRAAVCLAERHDLRFRIERTRNEVEDVVPMVRYPHTSFSREASGVEVELWDALCRLDAQHQRLIRNHRALGNRRGLHNKQEVTGGH